MSFLYFLKILKSDRARIKRKNNDIQKIYISKYGRKNSALSLTSFLTDSDNRCSVGQSLGHGAWC